MNLNLDVSKSIKKHLAEREAAQVQRKWYKKANYIQKTFKGLTV